MNRLTKRPLDAPQNERTSSTNGAVRYTVIVDTRTGRIISAEEAEQIRQCRRDGIKLD